MRNLQSVGSISGPASAAHKKDGLDRDYCCEIMGQTITVAFLLLLATIARIIYMDVYIGKLYKLQQNIHDWRKVKKCLCSQAHSLKLLPGCFSVCHLANMENHGLT